MTAGLNRMLVLRNGNFVTCVVRVSRSSSTDFKKVTSVCEGKLSGIRPRNKLAIFGPVARIHEANVSCGVHWHVFIRLPRQALAPREQIAPYGRWVKSAK